MPRRAAESQRILDPPSVPCSCFKIGVALRLGSLGGCEVMGAPIVGHPGPPLQGALSEVLRDSAA
eukprot:15478647-Alexandrium_andersonii.AAC.1